MTLSLSLSLSLTHSLTHSLSPSLSLSLSLSLPAPILSTTDERGEWLLSPNAVAQEAAEQWGRLWKPPATGQEPQAFPFGDLPGMPPLMGELLWDIVRHIPRAKAQGLDAWAPDDLKALPRGAYDDLAAVLSLVEAEGKWLEGLSGAIVALLPKKGDHGPLAQRPPPDGV